MSRDKSLLDQIEEDALAGRSIADALRRVVALGGRASSTALRDWASKELKGYGPDDTLPEYRLVGAPICTDAIVGNGWIKGQRFSVLELPEFARDAIGESVPLHYGIGQIEAMIRTVESQGESSLHLSMPGSADLILYMNQTIDAPFQRIQALYWNLSVASLNGVVDQVRTTLTELVAEMRAGIPQGESLPSAEVANQAVSVAVHGDNARVVITTQHSGGNASMTKTRTSSDGEGMEGWWTPAKKVGGLLVGLATIAGSVIAYVQLVR